MFLQFETQELKPFGLTITAKRSAPESLLKQIPANELDALARKHRLVLLRGFSRLDREAFLSYCSGFPGRDVFQWSFGPVMEMREMPDPKNYLFSREKVPFHWDGAFATVPNYLVFSCVEAPSGGAGGETLFCDTEAIYSASSVEERKLFAKAVMKYETSKIAHYGGVIEAPLVQRHPESGSVILRYAEPVATELNPVSLEIKGVESFEAEAIQNLMQERIYDPQFCYEHEWEEGDLLIADNHSLIHGRKQFELGSPRHLRRIQLI